MFNYPIKNKEKPKQERNSGETRTIPDISLSITQIMERTRRGLPVTHSSRLMFQDLKNLDLVEKEELEQKTALKLLDLKELVDTVNKNNDIKAQQDAEEQFKKMYEKHKPPTQKE